MPASEWVVSGTRQIEVPCNDWTMRQPLAVQVLCLLDLLLAVVFVLNVLLDLQGWSADAPPHAPDGFEPARLICPAPARRTVGRG